MGPTSDSPPTPEGAAAPEAAEPDYIGVASMTDDGTIVLDLRAEAPDGTIGDARLYYPKSHQQYSYILEHLGGLEPGEEKSVLPFPPQK